jgi:lysyl-tRNA synthetase class 2
MDEREARLAKLEAIRAAGVDPYPTTSERTHTIAAALRLYEAPEGIASDDLPQEQLTLAGRIMLWRDMGKSVFAHIEDGTGRMQVYFRKDVLGEEAFARLKWLDLGDTVETTGTLFTTRTGEKTLKVSRWRLLSKSLLPLPAKGAGGDLKLFDPETRHRKRYLDLVANREEVVPVFVGRSTMVQAMREFMFARGFVEVETPVLQPLYGGATARPFTTHHNTLDRDLYLRIAPELYLKRLIVGGLERVFEIARNFRNEGIDRSHNPEFTMMECYQAYADYQDMMSLTEELVAHSARAVNGTTRVLYSQVELDLAPPWKRMSLREAIAECTGIDYEEYPTVESLGKAMRARGYDVDPALARGRLIDSLKDVVIKGDTAKIKEPLFLYDYPRDLSPLAKQKPGTADTAERFQAFAGGIELANAFTELNDPLDQRARFEDQARQRAGGDDEAQVLDEDYIEALEVGMPPTGGMGIGVDRLAMLLTGQDSIREVILFPTMRDQG